MVAADFADAREIRGIFNKRVMAQPAFFSFASSELGSVIPTQSPNFLKARPKRFSRTLSAAEQFPSRTGSSLPLRMTQIFFFLFLIFAHRVTLSS